jgi:hypothetical protein
VRIVEIYGDEDVILFEVGNEDGMDNIFCGKK